MEAVDGNPSGTSDLGSARVPAFEVGLIRRYDRSGPRYTSYPPVTQFDEGFGEADYRALAGLSNRGENARPLSLYFHLPFCDTVCFYCACNKIITANHRHAGPYVDHLCREIALQSELFDAGRPVEQLHWGGGTPTFLSAEEMRRLMACTREHFKLLDDSGEYSVEVDPRAATGETIELLRELGFNRLSVGVQDFDPAVQRAVNRIQSEHQTRAVIEAARVNGFGSINFDLIYGLPRQSVRSFSETLERVIELAPDRLSVFNYAHLPQRFKVQRQIDESELPSPDEKLGILSMTMERLVDAGYVYIGMDHFARPEDELAVAQRNRTLHRNFQGYTTHADCDLVAMGITAISAIGDSYCQNVRSIDEYYPSVAAGRIPVARGRRLSPDDLLRREVIMSLICHGRLLVAPVEARHGIRFERYFEPELASLERMADDGLLRFDSNRIEITAPGMFLVRNICMVFDAYLEGPSRTGATYSRAI